RPIGPARPTPSADAPVPRQPTTRPARQRCRRRSLDKYGASSARRSLTRRSLRRRGSRLAQMSVDLLFRVGLALELQHAEVFVDNTVERHLDRPWPREYGRIFYGSFVLEVVRAKRRVTLDDACVLAHIVARAIEPCLAVQARDLDDQRVAVPACVRPPHPAVERGLAFAADEQTSEPCGVLINDRNVALVLKNLERVRHVSRSRHTA